MSLTPITPTHPDQRIDQTFTASGELVEELVYAYPFDGTAVRRREDLPDEPITGLPIPQPSAAELLRAEIAALPAPTMPADVLDVLDRALALLDGA